MISHELLDSLVVANIIREGTEIDAYYKGKDVAGNDLVPVRGTFIIMEAQRTISGAYVFTTASAIDGSRRKIKGTDIIIIDGMAPSRLAVTYGLSPTGRTMQKGKRRGRKPRNAETV